MKLKDMELKHLDWLISEVKIESQKQIKKWGIQIHTPFEWLTYTTEELGELAKAISEYEYRNGSIEKIIKEAIQVATLSLKIAESYREKLIFIKKLATKYEQKIAKLEDKNDTTDK